MRLGELLAVARECKGWTLRELEKKTGVSNALISQIETGKVKEPGFFTVLRIARALGLSLDRVAACDPLPEIMKRLRTLPQEAE